MGTHQPVKYEELHQICFGCREFGHRHEACLAITVVHEDSFPMVQLAPMLVEELPVPPETYFP